MHVDTPLQHFILVVQDRLFREALAARLTAAGITVSGVTCDTEDVPKELVSQPGAILVVHVIDSGGFDFDGLKDLKSSNPSVKLVVICRSAEPATVAACLEVGVSTVLDDEISFDTFLNYLRFVALEERALPASMVSSLFKLLRPHVNSSQAADVFDELTPREKVVLIYLTEGASNKDIARDLGLADGTVKVNVKTILRKINAANRTQAAVWALQFDIRGDLLRGGFEFGSQPPGAHGRRDNGMRL